MATSTHYKETVSEDANYYTIKSDRQMYQNWLQSQNENSYISRKQLKEEQLKLLANIIKNELPEKQRRYFELHFYEGKKPIEIARMLGVHKSTVSRQLKNAALTVRRFSKYISMDLYKIVEKQEAPDIQFRTKRNNRKGRKG